jgi:hypothetical protein
VRRGGNGSDAADFITRSVLNMIGRELIVQHCRHVSYTNHSRGKAKARGHQRAMGHIGCHEVCRSGAR